MFNLYVDNCNSQGLTSVIKYKFETFFLKTSAALGPVIDSYFSQFEGRHFRFIRYLTAYSWNSFKLNDPCRFRENNRLFYLYDQSFFISMVGTINVYNVKHGSYFFVL